MDYRGEENLKIILTQTEITIVKIQQLTVQAKYLG